MMIYQVYKFKANEDFKTVGAFLNKNLVDKLCELDYEFKVLKINFLQIRTLNSKERARREWFSLLDKGYREVIL